ncbi:MAG: FtsX-like permease family protein, partial [Acidobacteriota bacterium]
GLYGVVSWSVARRAREYGIRQALGASGRDVIGVVVRGALRLVAVGVSLGLLLAFALSRVLGSLLHEVGSLDALTYAAVVAAIIVVALAASLVPALRATRVDPVESLRAE